MRESERDLCGAEKNKLVLDSVAMRLYPVIMKGLVARLYTLISGHISNLIHSDGFTMGGGGVFLRYIDFFFYLA